MKKHQLKQQRSQQRHRKQRRLQLVLGIILVLIVVGVYIYGTGRTERKTTSSNRIAVIETSMGTMELELYEDKAPITTSNFIALANRDFYNGVIFHRVVKGFVIQGGDPTGTGRGGSGTTIPDEVRPDLRHDSIGVLSMANSGPNTGSSQFFITLAPAPHLDGRHSVFGKLIKGEEVLLAIGSVQVDSQDRPLNPVAMKITIKERS